VITSALAGRLGSFGFNFLRDIQDYLVARLRLHAFRQDSSDDQIYYDPVQRNCAAATKYLTEPHLVLQFDMNFTRSRDCQPYKFK